MNLCEIASEHCTVYSSSKTTVAIITPLHVLILWFNIVQNRDVVLSSRALNQRPLMYFQNGNTLQQQEKGEYFKNRNGYSVNINKKQLLQLINIK